MAAPVEKKEEQRPSLRFNAQAVATLVESVRTGKADGTPQDPIKAWKSTIPETDHNPQFIKGQYASGNWTVRVFTPVGGHGTFVYLNYKGEPVRFDMQGILSGRFDLNSYKGDDTNAIKLSSLLSTYALAGKEEAISDMIVSFATFIANQQVYKIAIQNCLLANGLIVQGYNEDDGKPIPFDWSLPCHFFRKPVDPAKPAAPGGSIGYWVFSSKLKTEKTQNPNVREHKIVTPIVVREKGVTTEDRQFTRGELSDFVQNKTFHRLMTGTLSVFVQNGKKLFMTASSLSEFLTRLKGTGEFERPEAIAQRANAVLSALHLDDDFEDEDTPSSSAPSATPSMPAIDSEFTEVDH